MALDDSLSERAREMFAVIERYRAGTLTRKSFCEAEGLALSTFQYWISRHRKHQLQEAQQPPEGAAASPQRFVELKPQSCNVASPIVLRYPNGVSVSLETPENLAFIKELIYL